MDKLLEAVKESEGFRDRVYKCTAGVDTIGYGFAVKDLILDRDIADIILERKLAHLMNKVDDKFKWMKYMPEPVQDVVYEMVFQLGLNGFSKFKKAIAHLEGKRWDKASAEMLDSLWAKQTPNRAIKLSNIVKAQNW
tara:strand:+ start:15250 stop:15660 length:411 start_codon:yes stop_codon:yes gene_type:complete